MGHNGDLGNGLGVLFQSGDQGVAHLVVGNQPLFHLGEHGVLLFRTGNDGFKGNQQVLLVHGLPAHADGPQGGFVHQVGQIRAYGAGGGLGDLLKIHILGELDLPGMDLQGIQTALVVGPVHDDPAVKPAGPQQGLVQNLGPVGGGQTHDALGGLKAVDFAEELVEGLLLLGIVAVAVVPAAAHGVDFVNEDDAGCHLCRLLEQIPDPAGAHAHKHLHKIGTGNGEEGHIGFTGHRPGKQGLAGAGRAHQQGALGQLGADFRIALGIVEEIDDLLQGFLGFVLTGHILKGDAGLLFHVDLGLALAEAPHHPVAAHALGQGAHEHKEDGKGDAVIENHQDKGIVLLNFLPHVHPVAHKLVGKGEPVAGRHTGIAGPLLGGRLGGLLPGQVIDPVAPVLDLGQLVLLHGSAEIRIAGFRILTVGYHIIDPAEEHHQGQSDDQRSPKIGFGPVTARFFFVGTIILSIIHIYIASLGLIEVGKEGFPAASKSARRYASAAERAQSYHAPYDTTFPWK